MVSRVCAITNSCSPSNVHVPITARMHTLQTNPECTSPVTRPELTSCKHAPERQTLPPSCWAAFLRVGVDSAKFGVCCRLKVFQYCSRVDVTRVLKSIFTDIRMWSGTLNSTRVPWFFNQPRCNHALSALEFFAHQTLMRLGVSLLFAQMLSTR